MAHIVWSATKHRHQHDMAHHSHQWFLQHPPLLRAAVSTEQITPPIFICLYLTLCPTSKATKKWKQEWFWSPLQETFQWMKLYNKLFCMIYERKGHGMLFIAFYTQIRTSHFLCSIQKNMLQIPRAYYCRYHVWRAASKIFVAQSDGVFMFADNYYHCYCYHAKSKQSLIAVHSWPHASTLLPWAIATLIFFPHRFREMAFFSASNAAPPDTSLSRSPV